MTCFDTAASLLPPVMRKDLLQTRLGWGEELRLRRGYRPTILTGEKEISFSASLVTQEDILCVLERASGASLHAVADQMLKGYISYHGIRIGVCGAAVTNNSDLVALKDFSSVAIRIPREIQGQCNEAVSKICFDGFKNTLIVAPPGGGKTTALREIIRSLSVRNYRVSVIDERNELSAWGTDGPMFYLGESCDTLVGVDKERGSMMMLRGMNPHIIAMDEISKSEDIETISEINGCGVKLLATAHAADIEDMKKRRLYEKLLSMDVFTYFVIISGFGKNRKYSVMRLAE